MMRVFNVAGALTAVLGEFSHPGALESQAEVDFVKAKIEAGQQPWTQWFQKAQDSSYATQSAHGVASLDAAGGAAGSGGEDASASYVLALLYKLSGEDKYAQMAMKILNSWADLQEIVSS